MDVGIQKLSLKDAAPFTKGQLSELSGSIDGKMRVSGTMENPVIDGKMHTHESGFTLDYLNTHYTLHDENIIFSNKEVVLKDFRVSDSADTRLL